MENRSKSSLNLSFCMIEKLNIEWFQEAVSIGLDMGHQFSRNKILGSD